MTHEEIKILISAYIDGEVTPSEKNLVQEHLSTCASCQKDYKKYMAMSSSLSKWSNETLSPDEAIKVQRRFEQRREPMFTQRTATIFATTFGIGPDRGICWFMSDLQSWTQVQKQTQYLDGQGKC